MSDGSRETGNMSKNTDDLQRAFEEGWEISEDDFMETKDLAETAAQLQMAAPSGDADEYEEYEEDPEEEYEDWSDRRRESVSASFREETACGENSRRTAGKRRPEAAEKESRRASSAHRGNQEAPPVRRQSRAVSSARRQNRPVSSVRGEDRQASADRRGKRQTPPARRTGEARGRADAGRRRGRKENAFLTFLKGLSAMDRVIGLTGAAVCLFAAFTFTIVLSARTRERQVEAFSQVGEELAQISVADESTFLAVADGLLARQQAAAVVEPEYEEKDVTSDVQVGLNMTSVEKDLKIKFVNRGTGKLIPYVAFEAKITGPEQTWNKTDDDEDGIIYLTGIPGGDYMVEVTGPEDLEGYVLPDGAQSVTVKNQISYEKIDVSDEIKSESEVNAAAEDT